MLASNRLSVVVLMVTLGTLASSAQLAGQQIQLTDPEISIQANRFLQGVPRKRYRLSERSHWMAANRRCRMTASQPLRRMRVGSRSR